ncbi:oxidoreductase [candidate division BRC1 bacterium HGW-BRC1-1]|nr:MAG: oxidoreductase [candidate division BRC1 bacterium HGW-BRC1-1]
MPRRSLGSTGEHLSVIGFGGILVMGAGQSDANNLVAEAMERGINYYDVAPSYGDAEERLGPALAPYRNEVFLACKTEHRDGTGARAHLEQSLRNLQTDHFDLYQLHALTDLEKDVDAVLKPGGALDALSRARDEGLIRYLGFSAHSSQAALRAMEAFPFDTILYPINLAAHVHGSFETAPLQEARKRGLGILALKALARGAWDTPSAIADKADYPKCWYEPFTRREDALQGLRFTLGQPGVTAALPPGHDGLWRMALELLDEALALEPPSEEELRHYADQLKPVFS